uniref:SRPBCC domain-containing protein n=1 Tax=Phenylobacterium glaciei TaxID=2803784 RepID=A0A974S849_9CAUL|nr:SRPBCC domain-containing protein [Phenylobacterium glaciei]
MTDPAIDRELTITRVMDAPASLLFEAYSRPEHIMKWFGPVGWPVTFAEIDFRVGGAFKFAMTGPSGRRTSPSAGPIWRSCRTRRSSTTTASTARR